MAEIEIEPRRQRSWWPWVLGLLILAAVAAGAWWLLSGNDDPAGTRPAAEQMMEPAPRTTVPVDSPSDSAPFRTPPPERELEPAGEPGPGPEPGGGGDGGAGPGGG